MCGNEISSVTSPSADFHALVNSQLPTRKLVLSISSPTQKTTPSTQITPSNSTPSTWRVSKNFPSINVESTTRRWTNYRGCTCRSWADSVSVPILQIRRQLSRPNRMSSVGWIASHGEIDGTGAEQ